MTKLHDDQSNPHFETQASELYQQRKSRHKANSSMKRHTLAQAESASNWSGIFNRFQHVAIAAGTLLLVGLVALQSYELRQAGPEIEYTSVQIHSLESDQKQDYAQIKVLYDQHRDDYLKQKVILASHHKKAAFLSQFDDGWELKTCDQELVKISSELVQILKEMKLINPQIKRGDSVQIAFNVNGLIVGIEPAKNNLQCT